MFFKADSFNADTRISNADGRRYFKHNLTYKLTPTGCM